MTIADTINMLPYERIKVFCRVRPFLESSDRRYCETVSLDQQQSLLPFYIDARLDRIVCRLKTYFFDSVFPPENSTNTDVVRHITESIESGSILGKTYNASVITYGQSGTGKTHSFFQADGLVAAIVRKVSYIS